MVASLETNIGAAGSGKSHKLIEIALALLAQGRPFQIVTPTNRASRVLNERLAGTGLKSGTIHKNFYTSVKTDDYKDVIRPVLDPKTQLPKRDKTGNIVTYTETVPIYKYTFKPGLSKELTIIIDEASMVTSQTWYDIFTNFKGHLIVFGDINQLNPVESLNDIKDSDLDNGTDVQKYYQYFKKVLAATPNLDLGGDENNRRLDSDTAGIRACIKHIMAPKNNIGEYPVLDNHPDYLHIDISNNNVIDSTILGFIYHSNVVVCWKNVECNRINELYRIHRAQVEGFTYHQMPTIGDRILAEAHFEMEEPVSSFSDETRPSRIINKGDEYTIAEIERDDNGKVVVDKHNNLMFVKLRNQEGNIVTRKAKDGIVEPYIPLSIAYITGGRVPRKVPYLHWCYAYAITCHKAQGSGWDVVTILDSYYAPEDARRWRYTAATRARKNLIVVRSKNMSFERRAVL